MRPNIAIIPPPSQETCLECSKAFSYREAQYSLRVFKISLCSHCQSAFKLNCQKASKNEIALYKGLLQSGVLAKLQKFDDFKTIDIVVPEAMVHIEVDGSQHNTKADQALKDLKRTYFSLKEGYFTLRIPNSLVRTHFKEALTFIIGILELRKTKLGVSISLPTARMSGKKKAG
jgi:very-short-patch-repair endonuclease